MKNHNLEKMPRKKLSKYVGYGDRFGSIYMIVFSIFWMVGIISIFYSNRDNTKHELGELVMLLPFLIFGCVFLGFGIYKLNKKIKRKKLKERLLLEGDRIIATVVDIESVGIMFKLGESHLMGRGSGFKIHAKYEDRNFISAKIGINVPKYVKVGDKIPVFVNLHNPEEYYMDLDNINSI